MSYRPCRRISGLHVISLYGFTASPATYSPFRQDMGYTAAKRAPIIFFDITTRLRTAAPCFSLIRYGGT